MQGELQNLEETVNILKRKLLTQLWDLLFGTTGINRQFSFTFLLWLAWIETIQIPYFKKLIFIGDPSIHGQNIWSCIMTEAYI